MLHNCGTQSVIKISFNYLVILNPPSPCLAASERAPTCNQEDVLLFKATMTDPRQWVRPGVVQTVMSKLKISPPRQGRPQHHDIDSVVHLL